MKLKSRPEKDVSQLLIELALACGLPERHRSEITSITFTPGEMKVQCASERRMSIGATMVIIPNVFIFPIK